MKKPKMKEGTECCICQKIIKLDEESEYLVNKQRKLLFYHKKCFENLKKKG